MLSLVKIRIKYIIRNPCLLFWTYILIPAVIIFAAIFVISNKKHYTLNKYEKEEYKNEPIKNFFNEQYRTIKDGDYMNFTAFLVDNKDICNKIYKVLKDNSLIEMDFDFEKNIICNNFESNFSNLTMNIIKIKKDEDKYRINLKSKIGDENEFIIKYHIIGNKYPPGLKPMREYIMYNNDDLDYGLITDAFYVYERNKSFPITKFNLFFELESLATKIILELENKPITDNFEMRIGYNKYPDSYRFASNDDNFLASLYSFLVTLQFALIAYNVNMRMIDEKEHKLNNLLERQGISKFQYNLSWLFTYLAFSLCSLIGFALLIYGETISHIYLTIINLLLYALSVFSVCVFFTVCIKTTKTGATAIKFYNFGSLFLGFVLVMPSTLKVTKVVFCFIPHINFYMNYWVTYCLSNFPNLNFNLLFLRAAKTCYFESMMMYIVNIIFYLGLAIFIESYKYSGLPFCSYLKSYCVKVSRNIDIHPVNKDEEGLKDEENENNMLETHFQELSEINKQKSEQNQSLKLINVSKSFDDLKAVKCFNGELFSNEIFCLLGHNGAGKSTTINMISGIYDPDEGDILLNGRSIVTNKKYLYDNIGLCQQEDIFFDYLTVEEHLEYMCKIKGSQVNHQEIDELIAKIELSPKKNALCSTLSGGQKRKLCIALALIGDSKIILLDEPTSGMDVMARRSLWEFLKNYKKDKIILLTTHFLDEAEYLGDRIGIMSDGYYLCCGTSTYLKSKYPCGFNINLIINSDVFNEGFKRQFYNELLKYEPKAEIKVASKGIFSVNIPSENKRIKEIFEYIEKSKANLGIEDYTVASTSLEDVFLKINNKANLADQKYSEKAEFEAPLYNILPKASGFCKQLCAQIRRGFFPFYRNKTLFLFELLSGLGFVYLYILFFSDSMRETVNKKLSLTEVLSAHKVYINEKYKNFLESSDAFESYGTYITLKEIKGEANDIGKFMDLAYDQAFVNIAKGAMHIKEVNNGNIKYEVYNTEVNNKLYGYLYANTMLFVSSFLKKNYNIKASVFQELEFNPFSSGNINFLDFALDSASLVIVCLINFFGFVIFLGGLMLEKIKEKRTNIKHLLYLSGSNIFSYWLGFYVVDYIKLLIFSALLIAPIFTLNNVGYLFGLDMLAINLSSLSFIYFITFFCSNDDDGAKILFLFIFGFILIVVLLIIVFQNEVASYILNFTDAYKPTFFDMTPITSMVLSFIRIILSFNTFNELDEKSGDLEIEEFFGFRRPEIYLYTSYICQAINLVFYTFLLIFAESGLLGKLIHYFHIKCLADADIRNAPLAPLQDNQFNINNNYNVQSPLINKSSNIIPISDNNNIINTNSNNYINQINQNKPVQSLDFNFNGENLSGNPLQNPYVEEEINKVYSEKELTTRLINVTKTFYPCCSCCCREGKVRAINHLYLGLEPNEKFGLLGFNGSGKTTTFKAITNEIMVDCGSINLFGYDTKRQFNQIRTMVGYCPQINPLFDFMKVREIIYFYSKLKTCFESTESICEKFGLGKYMDTYTINLSGGNKRKLTFAIAMMNKPNLLLLDEPSTGVDPESRRIMWRNINELSNSGHRYNMVLTTHSMEEAEILCDTVSWLRAGNFITVGNPEKLKIRYSAGYKLHIKFDSTNLISTGGDINQAINILSSMVYGFNMYANYLISNSFFEPYLRNLINVVEKIRDKTKKISLYLIGRDYSFELIIQIIQERKKDLFIDILNMKNENNTIDELTISMQSLENILTSI